MEMEIDCLDRLEIHITDYGLVRDDPYVAQQFEMCDISNYYNIDGFVASYIIGMGESWAIKVFKAYAMFLFKVSRGFSQRDLTPNH